jgi:hypothetical protein
MTLIEIIFGFALVVFCVGYLFLYEAGAILALQDVFLGNPTYDGCCDHEFWQNNNFARK